MLAEKEVRLRRIGARLIRQTARAAAKAYENGSQIDAEAAAKSFEGVWYRALVAHYTVTIKPFARYTREQIGSDSQRSFEEIVADFIQTRALRKSSLVNKTTVEAIREVIRDGSFEGLGPREIARDIRTKVGGTTAKARSDVIARTETHDAATFAGQATAEASGLDMDREWVTSIDGRERPEHAAADGQMRAMKEDFFVGGEYVSRPGEGSASNAIGCRCSIIYHPKR
jgi:SPP1 gp7 family putative phage head morphogenesis protein